MQLFSLQTWSSPPEEEELTKPNFFPRILPNLSLFSAPRFFSFGLSEGGRARGVKQRGLNLVCLQQQGVGPHAGMPPRRRCTDPESLPLSPL